MRFPVGIPLLVRNIKIVGPKGSIKVDMILDTGASLVSDRQEIITANGVIEVPKLRVDRISVGGAEAREVEVICHDIPEFTGIRGLLGLSFLKHFRTVIDYRQGYLELS